MNTVMQFINDYRIVILPVMIIIELIALGVVIWTLIDGARKEFRR